MPIHGCIAVKEKQAKLSHDSISFGHLPLFAVVRRLAFITNSSKHTLSFHWQLTSDRAKEVVHAVLLNSFITSLEPGSPSLCKDFIVYALLACELKFCKAQFEANTYVANIS